MKFTLLTIALTAVLAEDDPPKPQDQVFCSTTDIEDVNDLVRVHKCSTNAPCFEEKDKKNIPRNDWCKTDGEKCGEWQIKIPQE